eukprot:jgi/Botrbrau1/8134/Bobra.0308s0026.1
MLEEKDLNLWLGSIASADCFRPLWYKTKRRRVKYAFYFQLLEADEKGNLSPAAGSELRGPRFKSTLQATSIINERI